MSFESEQIQPDEIESPLNQAPGAAGETSAADIANVSRFEFKDLSGTPVSSEMATLELPHDVELDLRVELGRAYLYREDVLKLRDGAVVTLDKLADDPVDVYANGRLVARGEVLVLNDSFCVRVDELISCDAAEDKFCVME